MRFKLATIAVAVALTPLGTVRAESRLHDDVAPHAAIDTNSTAVQQAPQTCEVCQASGQPCGNVDGFPGKCGYAGPGCCGSAWDSYCRDKPACGTYSMRRHAIGGLGIPVGIGGLGAGCCDGALSSRCFTQCCPLPSLHLPKVCLPEVAMPCLPKLKWPCWKHKRGCDSVGCDVAGCDECSAAPLANEGAVPLPPQPMAPEVEPRDELVPPANPAPAAVRGFAPFSFNAPLRSPGTREKSAQRSRSLPY